MACEAPTKILTTLTSCVTTLLLTEYILLTTTHIVDVNFNLYAYYYKYYQKILAT